MNCPSCGAPMRLKPDADSYACDYCRSVYFPEKNEDGVRVLDEASGELCPICNLALVHAAIGSVRIRYCTRCHGMLIPMPVFETLIDELRSAGSGTVEQPKGEKHDLSRMIGCPRCRAPMDAHFYAGPGNVVIDSCESCELDWLDRGELWHIVRAPDGREPEPVFETVFGDDDTTGTAR